MTLRLDMENEPQPDAMPRIAPQCGGRARPDEDDYLTGAPELVAEVPASSASYDLHDKFRACRRNGVQEYLVWRVLDQAIDWFVLREGDYERLEPDESGLLRSEVFPGLWLDPAVMVARDMPMALQRLQEGLASPEHAQFVTRLQQARDPSVKP